MSFFFFWNSRIPSDFFLGILDFALGILEFLKIRHCGNSVIAREQSRGSNLVQGLINET